MSRFKIFEAFGLLYPQMDETATAAAMPKSSDTPSPPNVKGGKKMKGASTKPREVVTPDSKNRTQSGAPQKLGMPPPNVRGAGGGKTGGVGMKESLSAADIVRLAEESCRPLLPNRSGK
jgi:hypothetical protein